MAGPLSEDEFLAHPSVAAVGNPTWTAPRNPNVMRPLLGTLFFLAVTAIIFLVPLLLLIAATCVVAIAFRGVAGRRRIQQLRPAPRGRHAADRNVTPREIRV